MLASNTIHKTQTSFDKISKTRFLETLLIWPGQLVSKQQSRALRHSGQHRTFPTSSMYDPKDPRLVVSARSDEGTSASFLNTDRITHLQGPYNCTAPSQLTTVLSICKHKYRGNCFKNTVKQIREPNRVRQIWTCTLPWDACFNANVCVAYEIGKLHQDQRSNSYQHPKARSSTTKTSQARLLTLRREDFKKCFYDDENAFHKQPLCKHKAYCNLLSTLDVPEL